MELESALAQLKGPTDENRVVGLLMLTKHVSVPSASIRTAISNALDPTFLRRLLLTKTKIGDSATDALAIGMLSFFCRDDTKAALSYLDTLPIVCQKWTSTLQAVETSTEEISVSILQMIIDTTSCIAAFLSAAATSTASILTTVQQQTTQFQIVNLCLRTTLLLDKFDATQQPRIERLTSDIVRQSFAVTSKTTNVPSTKHPLDATLLLQLSTTLQSNTVVSLACLRVWALLCQVESSPLTSSIVTNTILSNVQKGIFIILSHDTQRLYEKDRNDCFVVSEYLMELRPVWFESLADPTSTVLLFQLVSVEIRLMTDTLGRLLVDAEIKNETIEEKEQKQKETKKTSNTDKDETKTQHMQEMEQEDLEEAIADAATLKRALNILPTCFGLLERAVDGLCTAVDAADDEDNDGTATTTTTVWSRLTSIQILKLRDCLVGSIKDILAFIKYVANEPPAFYTQYQSDTSNILFVQRMNILHDVVAAALRTISLWMLVDIDSIEIETIEIVRHVLKSPCLPGFSSESVSYFVGPGLVQLLHDDAVREELYLCNGHKTIVSQLKKRLKEIIVLEGSDMDGVIDGMSSIEVNATNATNATKEVDRVRDGLVMERKIDSAIAAAAAALQVCMVMVVQYGSKDAYVFEQVSEFVPKFNKLLNSKLMKKVGLNIVRPRSTISENAKHMLELLIGLGWSM